MDDIYFCPDCRAEHAEPHEAVLGHFARCLTCVLLLEALVDEQTLELQSLESRGAAYGRGADPGAWFSFARTIHHRTMVKLV
jgi:hypothetical protein